MFKAALFSVVLLVMPAVAAAATALTTGTPLPPIQVMQLDGRATSLNDLRGKPAIVTIWATWCTACLHEMPGLNAMSQEWSPKGLQVVALSIDAGEDARDKVANYLERRNLAHLRPLLDQDRLVASTIGLQGTPTTLILDKQGRVRDWVVGLANWSTPAARDYLTKLLAE